MTQETKISTELTPEQQAQIEATAQQLATSTPIPGVTTEMLEKGGELLSAGMDTLGAVADVAGLAVTAVEVVVNVAGAVAEVVGSIDLGGS
jgi:hypothetical protein